MLCPIYMVFAKTLSIHPHIHAVLDNALLLQRSVLSGLGQLNIMGGIVGKDNAQRALIHFAGCF